ncbi:hypothetical protein Tco_1384384 [Tanacetum coccineum]
MERAATTASSLEAEQDSDAQTRFEAASKQSNDPPLSRVNTLGSGEDSMKLIELMAHCTTLSELRRQKEVKGFIKSLIYSLIESWKSLLPLMEESRLSLKHPLEDISSIEDSDGISTLPTAEIFKQLALMGYVTTFDSLTFQKGHFSHKWKFLIHTILHCLSPKKTDWEQFSSNIATAIIFLATNRTFNFSNLIFKAMVKNLDSKTKFLMYPRFIQIFLNKHQRLVLAHKRTYHTHTLTQKLFSNMKRASNGYSGVNTPLFQTMLVQDQGEGSTISVVSHHTPTSGLSTSQPPSTPPFIQTTPVAEEAALMPHDSPLLRVHSLGSLSLNELTILCTSLFKKVESLESELKQTKHTYSTALIKLIKRVKKLEQTIKTSQARRRTNVVIFDAEEDEEDPSKQGRILIEELDMDVGISLVPQHVADQGRFDDTQVSDQPEEQLGVFSAAKVLVDATKQRKDVENVQTYTRRRRAVSTGSGGVSTGSELVSTAGVKAKDKGKAVIQESEPPKKIKKRVQVQISIDEELLFKRTQRLKRAGQDVEAKLAKRQRTEEVSESVQEQRDELSQEQLNQMVIIVPDEGINVEALQTKYPIIGWEVYSEDTMQF